MNEIKKVKVKYKCAKDTNWLKRKIEENIKVAARNMGLLSKDNFTIKNIKNVLIRIPLAIIFVHYFSNFLFDPTRIAELINIFTQFQSNQKSIFYIKEIAKLQKMTKFWPPHQGFGYYEFSFFYTISLILFLRKINISFIYESIFGVQRSFPFLKFVLTPFYVSIIPSIILLPMMRLAEMHIFVIFLNFFHVTFTSYVVYFIWFLFKNDEIQNKIKIE